MRRTRRRGVNKLSSCSLKSQYFYPQHNLHYIPFSKNLKNIDHIMITTIRITIGGRIVNVI